MNTLKKHISKASMAIFLVVAFSSCEQWDEGYAKDIEINKDLIPQVSFTVSETDIIPKESVSFTDTSTNEPYLYSWTFEGGTPSTSNEANPTVVYPGGGEFNVTLKARNDFGAAEVVLEKYIKVVAPPIIDIDRLAQLRYTFEENLDSDLEKGIQSITASSSGAAQYTTRPGGGKAYNFNGTNPLVIPGYTGINGAGARSVSLWLKTTNAVTSGLVHWGASGTFSRCSYKMNKNTGTIRFEYQGGGHNGAINVADGEWNHIAYTYDGNTITTYINGIQELSIPGKVLKTGASGETDVNIGSQLGGSKFTGAMDDVRIFDVVLTPEEVLVLSQMK